MLIIQNRIPMHILSHFWMPDNTFFIHSSPWYTERLWNGSSQGMSDVFYAQASHRNFPVTFSHVLYINVINNLKLLSLKIYSVCEWIGKVFALYCGITDMINDPLRTGITEVRKEELLCLTKEIFSKEF